MQPLQSIRSRNCRNGHFANFPENYQARPLTRLTLGMKVAIVATCLCLSATASFAQVEIPEADPEIIIFPTAHIVTFLFLMLGPTKILGPFVKLTAGAEPALGRKIALSATVFAGIVLLIAGFLGELTLRKHGVPLPILALAGGVILFLVAIQDTVRQFSFKTAGTTHPAAANPTLKLALDPLAFPVIVTPYGIAALIVFLSFARDFQSQLVIAAIVAVILLLNLLTMLFAKQLMATLGVTLAILGAVLSVVQVALGLQIISNSLKAMGLI